jgi:putative oxidoreductase
MATSEARRDTADDWGKLVLRAALGALILLHGIAKVFSGPATIIALMAKAGLPPALGYLVYVGEVVAPILVIVGLWTRPAALVVACNMAVAILLVHRSDILGLGKTGGWAIELQGIYFFAAIAVALLGAGRLSLGGKYGRWN